jgi:hypothetical protein
MGNASGNAEALNFSSRQLVIKINFREMGYEDGRWMELTEDRVHLQDFGLGSATRELVN